MGYIYLITNIVNKKQYVGQTQREDIQTRWNAHKTCDSKSCGTYLLRAYNKYKIENFKFQIICICFDEDCNRFEEEYIKKFNTLSPNGYNLKEGGKNSKHHPDTIKKLSEMNKGKNNPRYGKKLTQEEKDSLWTPEFRIKRRLENLGEKNPNFGKKSIHRKMIGMFTIHDALVKTFESIHSASIETKINERSISAVCNNRKKSAGGFIWKIIK
jgi:group I intron endonuclease